LKKKSSFETSSEGVEFIKTLQEGNKLSDENFDKLADIFFKKRTLIGIFFAKN